MNSIGVKITLLYIFLAILNISFFTVFIFENQIDLITENTKYKAESLAIKIYTQLFQVETDVRTDTGAGNKAELFSERLIAKMEQMQLLEDFLLFKEKGVTIFKTEGAPLLTDENKMDAARAVANKDLTGLFYFANINEKDSEIKFYIPFKIDELDNFILFFKLNLNHINNKIDTLYRFVAIIIGLISAFHIIFGILLHLMVIRPLKKMAFVSDKIRNGDLEARIGIKRKDEIGKLGASFDFMAVSVRDKIYALDVQNRIMQKELEMASSIQKGIYPTIRQTEKFDIAVYHKPLIEVSGDYHDIFPLKNGGYGFLVADVSGHGVGAALLTMIMKDIFQHSADKYDDSREFLYYVNIRLDDLMEKYNKYFTAFYMIIDRENRVCFSNAGHNEGYMIRPGRESIYTMDTDGIFLGFGNRVEKSAFFSKHVHFKPGDKIILYSDGIVETLNETEEEAYEHDRLMNAIYKYRSLGSERMLEKILEDYNAFVGNARKSDDETIMIIEIKQ